MFTGAIAVAVMEGFGTAMADAGTLIANGIVTAARGTIDAITTGHITVGITTDPITTAGQAFTFILGAEAIVFVGEATVSAVSASAFNQP